MINVTIDKSINCNPILSKKSAFIKCPYIPEIVEYLRNLQYRHYNANNKTWEIQEKDLLDFCKLFGPTKGPIDIVDCYVEEDVNKFATIQIPQDYKFLLDLYEHQREGIIFGLNHPNFLLGDEMGLGKSLQSLYITDIECKTGKVLVIVCSATLKYNWQEEIQKTLGQSSHILGTRTKTKKDGTIVEKEYGGKEKFEDLMNIDNIKEKYLITNRETLTLLAKKRGKGHTFPVAEKIEELCKLGKIEAIIIDEFHLGLKSIQRQGPKALLKIKDAKYKIAMTGTPILNSPMDIYVMMRWLSILPETYSFWDFKNDFAELDIYGNPTSYKNLPQLSELLRGIMLRRERKNCIDLPDKVYINEYIEMTDKQKDLYKVIQKGLEDEMNKMIYHTEPLSKLINLRKVTGYPWALDPQLTDDDNPKMLRMLELVKEITDNGNKVIIYSQWTTVTERVRELLKEYNPAYITGEVSQEQRVIEKNKLQEDPSCKVLIGNSAMGQGLTMTAANYFIFLDEPWNEGTKEQIEDRIYRIGQERNVTIYTLMCKNTIDEAINQVIHHKGELAHFLVDGQIDRSSYKNLLQALISFGRPRKVKA